MSSDIQVIAVDIDGTLLNSNHELTERTEKALRTAMEKGVQVVLVTGKTRTSARSIIDKLGLTTPGIFSQGLTVYNGDGSLRYQQVLDPDIIRRVLTFAEDRGFTAVAYSGNQLLMRAEHPVGTLLAQYHEPMPDAIGPLQNILDEMPINKLILYGPEKRIKALRWQLSMQLNGSVTLTQAQIPEMLEVLPPGASKGAALKRLLKDMGIEPKHVLAIGDGENDLEMVALAGIGVAVGNAYDKLKETADHVVASNDEDGVAEAIERFVLGSSLAKQEATSATTSTETEQKSDSTPTSTEGQSENA